MAEAKTACPPGMVWIPLVGGPLSGNEFWPSRDPQPGRFVAMYGPWDDDKWHGQYCYSTDCRQLLWTPGPKGTRR